jgi:acid phosphatase
MRSIPLFLLLVLFSAFTALAGNNANTESAAAISWPAGLPVYDHIVIVIEENKDYDQIIDQNADAPFINLTLRTEGANFTQMYGEEHISQGNYFWLFSGSNHNVGFKDVLPTEKIQAPNLGASLIANKRSFKGYAEGLPEIGSEVARKGKYVRKHVPWISFGNVPNGNSIETSSNLRFDDFPKDVAGFAKLPTVSIVVPNLDNDMHDGSIARGDAWLKKYLDAYYQWAKLNNSLLIVTWDENDDESHFLGLTNPFVKVDSPFKKDVQNRIPTIFAGARIKPGNYAEDKGITHVNILRTLEAMYGLPRVGAQQPTAAGGGIRDDFIITDVFDIAK